MGNAQIAAAAEPEAAAPSALVAPAVKPADIPVSAFAALPFLRSASLSPDGKRLVAVMNREGNSVLVTAGGDGSGMRGIMESDNSKFKFGWVRWVNNNRLIVGIHYPAIRPGASTTETRLLAMDFDGSKLVNLVPPSRDKSIRIAQIQDDVVDFMPDDGQHVLLSLIEDPQVFAPGVYKVDVNTGKRDLVLGPRRYIHDWISDSRHRVRVGVRREEANVEVWVCDPDGENWRTVWRSKDGNSGAVIPLGFAKDPQKLYVRAAYEGRDAVYEAQLDQLDAAGLPKLTLKQSHPNQDIHGSLIVSPATGEVLGINSAEEGDTQATFWTEPLRELARGIDSAFPKRYNRIFGFSDDENRYLVRSSGSGVPDRLYIGDRKKGTLNLLADAYPGLPEEQMSGKTLIKLKARDGLVLRAFLTRPRDAKGMPGPMILLPHGGPISRDNHDFDPWAEFLASRGYSVLQVNFRGSDGYGEELRQAGLKRWGLEMQDDLTDAVHWAVSEKIADPRKVCIVGGSYGGYAALMGAIKTPDLFRCAISLAGVTNLIDLSRYEASFVNGQALTDKLVGNYWNDRDQLKATSPSERAAEIKIPVLLMHGTADRQVPYDQAETMAKALKAAGKDFKFVTMTDADHQLSRQSDRLIFFTEMEAFLDAHIGKGAPAR